MMDSTKIIKDGLWFWPAMKCICGDIGCFDMTTDIGCRKCLIERGTIKVVTYSADMENSMTDSELIARQARKIEELQDSVFDLNNRISKARMHIYCIGGPLNDNRLGYSKAQMVTFWRISEELSGNT